jgi:hypothetical protein
MQLLASLPWFFTLIALAVQDDAWPSLPLDTIRMPESRAQVNIRASESYHSKQQQPRAYTIHSQSETFAKLPGTAMTFYHTEPMLYKIRFEGKCHSPHATSTWLYLRLMVDNYLLYTDRFLPNTADRHKYNTDYPGNDQGDYVGGFYWYTNSPSTTTCTFSDIMYLNPGLYVIDVGVRGGASSQSTSFPLYVHAGVLTVELVRFDRSANIGMQPMNVTLPNSTG